MNWGILNHWVSNNHFSHSQHHSGVDVQLTTQFSANFQRGLANLVYLQMTSFESTLVHPCLNSGVLMRISQSTTKMVLDLLERITFSSCTSLR